MTVQVKGTGGGAAKPVLGELPSSRDFCPPVDNYCHHGNRCSAISSVTERTYFEVCPLCQCKICVRDRHTKDEALFLTVKTPAAKAVIHPEEHKTRLDCGCLRPGLATPGQHDALCQYESPHKNTSKNTCVKTSYSSYK